MKKRLIVLLTVLMAITLMIGVSTACSNTPDNGGENQPLTYTVSFDANGGEGKMDNQIFTESVEQTLSVNLFTKTGYDFAGWALTQDGEKVYDDAQKITVNENKTLYAVWCAKTFDVTFNANGGEGTMSKQVFVYGVEQALSQNAFTQTGYDFIGWALSENGEKIYNDGQSISITGTLNLYALWQTKSYTVTFNANGGVGEMVAQTFTNGENKSLTYNNFEKTRSNFLGWALSENGDVVYYDGQQISVNGSIILYAVWEYIPLFTVSFDGAGGEGSMTTITANDDNEVELPYNSFSMEGYDFIGWAFSDGGSVQYFDGEEICLEESITLYAVWEIKTFTVTYNSNGGYGEENEQTFTYGQADVLYRAESYPLYYSKDYHDFVGWAETPNGSVVYTDEQQITVSSDITLYAVWEAQSFEITFDANGGEGEMTSQMLKYATDGSQKLKLNTFTKENYIFDGWISRDNYGGSFTDGQAIDQLTSNLTLYAIWSPKPLTLTFYAKGEVFTTQTVSYGVGGEITWSVPEVEGYTFEGWSFTDGGELDLYRGAWKTFYADTELYAVLSLNSYKLTFNANGGQGSMEKQTVSHGVEITINQSTFVRSGYTFAGWSTTANGDVDFEDGGKITLLNDTTIYAVWTEKVYTVSFDANGGTGTMTDIEATYEEIVELPTCSFEAPYGKKFSRWRAEVNGEYLSNYNNGARIKVTDDVILIAQWEQIYVSVYYFNNVGSNGGDHVNSASKTYGAEYTLTSIGRTGHSLKGYTTIPGGTVVEYKVGDKVVLTQTLKLYGVWQPNEITVYFYVAGNGSWISTQKFLYGVAQEIKPFDWLDDQFAGYNFAYWQYEDEYRTKHNVYSGDVLTLTSTQNISMYAWFEAESCTITYDANGGEGSMENSVVTETSNTLSTCTFTRDGFEFLGWAYSKNSSEVDKLDGASIGMTITNYPLNAPTLTLYAVWQEI